MILIGTHEGIYRWFEGCGWPIFHGLQGRAIVSLASPGTGLIAAIDREGQIFESVDNGQDWRAIPGPVGAAGSVAARRCSPSGASPRRSCWRRSRWAVPPRHRHAAAEAGGRGGDARFGTGPGAVRPGADARRGGGDHAGAPEAGPRRRARRPSGAALGKPEVAKGKVASAAMVQALAVGGGVPAPWFASVRRGLWRSLDEGTTWGQCPGLPDEVLAIRSVPTRPGASSWRPPTAAGSAATGAGPGRTAAAAWTTPVSSARSRSSPTTPTSCSPAPPRARRPGAARRGAAVRALREQQRRQGLGPGQRGFPEDFEHDVITDIRYDPAAPTT